MLPQTIRERLGAKRSFSVLAAWEADPRLCAEQRRILLLSLTWTVDSGCGEAMAACADRVSCVPWRDRPVTTARAMARDLAICVLG